MNGTGLSSNGALRSISGANTYGGVITLVSNSSIGVDANSLGITQGITDGASTFSLTKVGAGTLTLSGANTYDGATTISNGTLALGGSGTVTTSPTISVASGATFDLTSKSSGFALAGNQTLSGLGSVTLAAGQSLSVGTSSIIGPNTSATSGTLSVGGLTLASGGKYQFTLTSVSGTAGGVSGWDLISVTNALAITSTSGSQFNIDILSDWLDWVQQSFQLFIRLSPARASITGFDPAKFSFTNGISGSNGTFSLSSDGTSLAELS